MIKQVLDEILKAEKQAEKIMADADAKIRVLQNQNQIEIEKIKEQVSNELKAQIKQLETHEEADYQIADFSYNDKDMVKKIDKAKDFVIKALLDGGAK